VGIVNGKNFAARSADGTLWEVKTGDFECRLEFKLLQLEAELAFDQAVAAECGMGFQVLVTEECLLQVLRARDPLIAVVFQPSSWCQ
jgi:hypothetical protein